MGKRPGYVLTVSERRSVRPGAKQTHKDYRYATKAEAEHAFGIALLMNKRVKYPTGLTLTRDGATRPLRYRALYPALKNPSAAHKNPRHPEIQAHVGSRRGKSVDVLHVTPKEFRRLRTYTPAERMAVLVAYGFNLNYHEAYTIRGDA